jgi:2-polyprenyl-3-methyl-5-hydroxy-6-metoxy-1,4-benzoquinol methylase
LALPMEGGDVSPFIAYMQIDRPYTERLLREALKGLKERLDPGALAEMGIPSYLEGNPLSRWFAWRKARHLLELCGNPAGAHVLDYGCGSGIMFPALLTCSETIYAADTYPVLAEWVAKGLNSEKIHLIVPGDVEERIGDGSLNLVLAANVLEHVSAPAEIVSQFRRKLGRDGSLIVSGPTENGLYRVGRRCLNLLGHKEFTGAYHVRTIRPIFKEIENLGFRLDRVVRMPFPGPGALYWIGRFRLE